MTALLKRYCRVLTIAGSDSGGGAGIQADLKTFSACGCYGTSAITAITSQNTLGVNDIHPVPVTAITAQIDAVLDDIGTDAIKIGMLHSPEVVEAVADALRRHNSTNIIVDPVMVATSGDRLIAEAAVDALTTSLFPLAALITPNIPEAELLSGRPIRSVEKMTEVARALSSGFGGGVLVKGGHLHDDMVNDIFLAAPQGSPVVFTNKRLPSRNTHGTGCSLSSAIAAFLARGSELEEAVAQAEKYLHQALAAGAEYHIGEGHGPIHHFYRYW